MLPDKYGIHEKTVKKAYGSYDVVIGTIIFLEKKGKEGLQCRVLTRGVAHFGKVTFTFPIPSSFFCDFYVKGFT